MPLWHYHYGANYHCHYRRYRRHYRLWLRPRPAFSNQFKAAHNGAQIYQSICKHAHAIYMYLYLHLYLYICHLYAYVNCAYFSPFTVFAHLWRDLHTMPNLDLALWLGSWVGSCGSGLVLGSVGIYQHRHRHRHHHHLHLHSNNWAEINKLINKIHTQSISQVKWRKQVENLRESEHSNCRIPCKFFSTNQLLHIDKW